MLYKELVIKNPTGLHARPATEFVAAAKKYDARIQIYRKDEPEEKVNAKSIVMLLSLGLGQGESVCIVADGNEEEAAITTIAELVDSGFGEL